MRKEWYLKCPICQGKMVWACADVMDLDDDRKSTAWQCKKCRAEVIIIEKERRNEKGTTEKTQDSDNADI